jgi:hypothetical protein
MGERMSVRQVAAILERVHRRDGVRYSDHSWSRWQRLHSYHLGTCPRRGRSMDLDRREWCNDS